MNKLFSFVPINIVTNVDSRSINSKCVILDIETTGLDSQVDKIIQFGAIKYKNEKILEMLEFFIDPEIAIPPYITDINHITNEDVKNQIKIKKGLKKIISFIDDAYLIAHNGLNFDLKFLNSKLLENKMAVIKNPLLDTLWLSKAINPLLNSHSLINIVKHFNISYDFQKAHKALYDTQLLSQVWQIMKQRIICDFKISNLKAINKIFVKIPENSVDLSKIHE